MSSSATSPPRVTQSRRDALILTVAAVLVRFPTLGAQSFDRDEAFTAGVVLHPGLVDTGRAIGSETSPPLFYFLVWPFYKLFGNGEVSLRFVSAAVGAATAPVAYELGRTLASRRVGLVIGALVAVNPLLFWYSQDARPYALLVFLGTLSLLLMVKALEAPTTPRLAGWAVAAAAAFATHWFAGFLIGPEAVWLVARSRDRRRAAWAVAAAAAAMAVLVPLLIHQAIHGGGDWIATIQLGDRLRSAGEGFLVGVYADRLHPAPLAALALVVAGLALLVIRADGRDRRGGLLALGMGGAAILLPLAISLIGPDFLIDKNLLAALVPLGLAVAAGMGARRAGKLGVALAAGLIGLSLGIVIAVSSDAGLQRWDWRDAVRAMGRPHASRAIVLPFNGDASLEIQLDEWRLLTVPHARVSEVVVFGNEDPREVRLPSGFREVERRRLRSFPMTRYRAARPQLISRRALAMTRIGGRCIPDPKIRGCEQSTVLLQGPES